MGQYFANKLFQLGASRPYYEMRAEQQVTLAPPLDAWAYAVVGREPRETKARNQKI